MRLSRRELIGQLLLFWMTMQPISTRSKNRSNDPCILADMAKQMGRFSYKEMSRDIWSFVFCTTPLLMLSGHAAQCKIVLHMSPSCFLTRLRISRRCLAMPMLLSRSWSKCAASPGSSSFWAKRSPYSYVSDGASPALDSHECHSMCRLSRPALMSSLAATATLVTPPGLYTQGKTTGVDEAAWVGSLHSYSVTAPAPVTWRPRQKDYYDCCSIYGFRPTQISATAAGDRVNFQRRIVTTLKYLCRYSALKNLETRIHRAG
jgi:hypothetical protein